MATLHCFRLTLILAISLLAAAPLAADALDDYIKLQTGSFTTAQQARLDARHGTAIWHMAEVWLPAGGAPARACVEANMADPRHLVEIMVTACR
jgi:enamine deaminase RidA (YjgF/YER057c/UK114 family)